MRVVARTQPIAVSISIHELSKEFDRMLDNLQTLNFRASEKGLLTDLEVPDFNETIDRVRVGMKDFFGEESSEPSHSHMPKYE